MTWSVGHTLIVVGIGAAGLVGGWIFWRRRQQVESATGTVPETLGQRPDDASPATTTGGSQPGTAPVERPAGQAAAAPTVSTGLVLDGTRDVTPAEAEVEAEAPVGSPDPSAPSDGVGTAAPTTAERDRVPVAPTTAEITIVEPAGDGPAAGGPAEQKPEAAPAPIDALMGDRAARAAREAEAAPTGPVTNSPERVTSAPAAAGAPPAAAATEPAAGPITTEPPATDPVTAEAPTPEPTTTPITTAAPTTTPITTAAPTTDPITTAAPTTAGPTATARPAPVPGTAESGTGPTAITDGPEQSGGTQPVSVAPAAREPVEERAAAPAVPAQQSRTHLEDDVRQDDLRQIEGIGPKMASALKAAGFRTYLQLADASEADLRAAIRAAGLRSAPGLPNWSAKARQLAGAGAAAGADRVPSS